MFNSYQSFQPLLTQSGLAYYDLQLKSTPANPILNGIVHSYLQITTTKPTPYPMIPDGTQAIFFSKEGSLIGGAQTKTRNIKLIQAGQYFGIRFYPGALRYFFNVNVSEITDSLVDFHFLPNTFFKELHQTIYDSNQFYERANLCEQWLLRHFKPSSITQFDHALSLIYQSYGNIKITHLANTVAWSSRHLNRMFRFHTGLSTKVFAQTIRLQHVCKNLYLPPNNALNTALELGFFDHSHLIRDYKKRLLAKPSMFFEHFMSDSSYR